MCDPQKESKLPLKDQRLQHNIASHQVSIVFSAANSQEYDA